MTSPRRITLVTAHLGLGGAERVLCLMANYWCRKGWSVSLLTLGHGVRPALHKLEPNVKWTDLDLGSHRRRTFWPLNEAAGILRLRRAIKESSPDAVIAFLNSANIPVLMATVGMPVPIIVSERIDPHHEPIRLRDSLLRRLLYPRAACVTTQTRNALEFFSFAIQKRGRVIPNPVLPAPPNSARSRQDPGRVVVGVGRLAIQKRFDRLIRAFASVASKHAEWILEIWGDGDQRERLQDLVRQSGLQDRIVLRGRTDDVYGVMANADLFVLSSDYEGFPNVLCEALATGLPVISTDCPSGPGEVIRNGENGILVPVADESALSQALDRLMESADERARLGANGRAIVDAFNVDRVMSTWENVIEVATIS